MKNAEEFRLQLSTEAFLATILVVMCHVDDKFCGDSFVVKFLGGIFSDANVANFFFLPGYFLAKKAGHEGWYLNELVKRIRTLIVPLVAWSLITAAIYEVATMFGVVSGNSNTWNLIDMFGLKNVSPEQVFGPLDFPLWYIETLMLFVVVSPVVFLLVKKFRNCGWLLPLVIVNLGWLQNLFGFSFLPYSVFGIRFHSFGFACFAAGAYVSISNHAEKFCFHAEGSNLWKVLGWLAAWVGVALVMVVPSRLVQHAHPYYVFFSVFCLHRIVANSAWRVPNVFVKSTFVIYASHYVVLGVLAKLIDFNFTDSLAIVAYVHTVAFLVLFGVAETVVLQKTCPPILALLTGGRG